VKIATVYPIFGKNVLKIITLVPDRRQEEKGGKRNGKRKKLLIYERRLLPTFVLSFLVDGPKNFFKNQVGKKEIRKSSLSPPPSRP
jgi:hypothetical protein